MVGFGKGEVEYGACQGFYLVGGGVGRELDLCGFDWGVIGVGTLLTLSSIWVC